MSKYYQSLNICIYLNIYVCVCIYVYTVDPWTTWGLEAPTSTYSDPQLRFELLWVDWKKSAYKWTLLVHTCVVQGSTVYVCICIYSYRSLIRLKMLIYFSIPKVFYELLQNLTSVLLFGSSIFMNLIWRFV